MKIAVASDLHLEFADLEIINTDGADVLVLAGDILVAADLHNHPTPEVPYPPAVISTLGKRQRLAQEYRNFIGRASANFPHVVVVAGNHEFYHGKWVGGIQTLRDEYGAYPNVHFLERGTVVLGGTVFVGGTLWTDMNGGDPVTLHAIQDMMNDYQMVRHDELGYTKLRPDHTLARHKETLNYFTAVIDSHKEGKVVVVSHMAPSRLSISDRYKNQSIMNGAFASSLEEFILDRPQITAWIHGHLHSESDYTLGNTRIICHPRGYVGYERQAQEAEPYYPKLVEI